MLEQMNGMNLKDLQGELHSSTDLYELISALGDQIQRERKDLNLAKSQGKERGSHENQELRRKIEDLQDRLREYEMNRTNHLASKKEQINKDLLRELEAAKDAVEDMRGALEAAKMDNHKLREQVRYLEDLSKNPRSRTGRSADGNEASATAMLLTRKENEQLRQEVRGLKDRVAHLQHELEIS